MQWLADTRWVHRDPLLGSRTPIFRRTFGFTDTHFSSSQTPSFRRGFTDTHFWVHGHPFFAALSGSRRGFRVHRHPFFAGGSQTPGGSRHPLLGFTDTHFSPHFRVHRRGVHRHPFFAALSGSQTPFRVHWVLGSQTPTFGFTDTHFWVHGFTDTHFWVHGIPFFAALSGSQTPTFRGFTDTHFSRFTDTLFSPRFRGFTDTHFSPHLSCERSQTPTFRRTILGSFSPDRITDT